MSDEYVTMEQFQELIEKITSFNQDQIRLQSTLMKLVVEQFESMATTSDNLHEQIQILTKKLETLELSGK